MAGVHAMVMGSGGGGGELYLMPNGVTIAAEPFVAKGKWHTFEDKDYYVAIDYYDLVSVVSLYKGLRGEGEVLANLNRDGQTKSIPLNQVVTTYVDKLGTGAATGGLFYNSRQFNQLINSWDVSNVTSMIGTFLYCTAYNQPLNYWDTSNCSTMAFLFSSCHVFNQDINNWDVSNVTVMESTFQACIAYNQPLNYWDTSNCSTMVGMFYGCRVFNQDIGTWDVSSVTDMKYMFNNAAVFNQDLSPWCVSKIPSKPDNFDYGTSAAWTTEMKPNWGAPC